MDDLTKRLLRQCLETIILFPHHRLQECMRNFLLQPWISYSNCDILICGDFNLPGAIWVNFAHGLYVEGAESVMSVLCGVFLLQLPQPQTDSEPTDFTRCCISKNVTKLLELGQGILEEALIASPECAGRLFCTVQNIVLKYITFVPEHHMKYLQSLPQQIALFHNNCLYITYVLNDWHQKYCLKLKRILYSCDFFNESKQLPLVALEVFSKHIEGQVKQINEIMDGAQLHGNTIEKLDPKTEKCVRQCLRQQELLKTVWFKVLSYSVYNKNLGVIVDVLCKFMIKSVIKFEDISTEVATNLNEVIKLILTRAPKLFTNSEEVPIFIPSWYKLNELHFLLDASLATIDDRWADGKGPLALQFERAELKQIIKALFQNTDRRAALLAKI